MVEQTKKIYLVTQGDYSDYGICKIFLTPEAAEKHISDNAKLGWAKTYDRPRVEVWDVEQ